MQTKLLQIRARIVLIQMELGTLKGLIDQAIKAKEEEIQPNKYVEPTIKSGITPIPETLPHVGKSRWSDIKPFCPVSREPFRKLSIEGRAPRAERLGIRCTMFDNQELHRWLNDPINYIAPSIAKQSKKQR